MTADLSYEALRHFADSWGLLFMFVLFAVLVLWPFRKGARQHHEDAANLIFKDDDHV